MKTISKKQFENAVQKVLAGGKSVLISTREVYPFYWTRSKGYNNLCGSIPQNSKLISNSGRGGKASDKYLVCSIADGYQISETKQEKETREKSELKKAKLKAKYAKDKMDEKKIAELKKAESFGLTVKDYRKKLAELKTINEQLYSDYLQKKNDIIIEFNFQLFKIVDRVKLARIMDERQITIGLKSLKDIL